MASNFIPKPEDQRLVWKRATGEVREHRAIDRGRGTSGVVVPRGQVGGQRIREFPHYLLITVVTPLLGLGTGFQHGIHEVCEICELSTLPLST